jgi:hypothetical protein
MAIGGYRGGAHPPITPTALGTVATMVEHHDEQANLHALGKYLGQTGPDSDPVVAFREGH